MATFFDGDGFDDYNGLGVSPGIQANWVLAGTGAASLQVGRFGVGQRLRLGASGVNNRLATMTLPSAVGTLTVGFMFAVATLPTGNAVGAHFALLQAGTYQVGWRITTLGEIVVYRLSAGNAGTELFRTPINTINTAAVEYYIETTVVISDTLGQVIIRLDGTTTVVNISAQDTKNHATLATVNQIQLGPTVSEVDAFDYDDMYWRDDSTMIGDVRWEELKVNGDGATLNWTPSTGVTHNTLLDEATVDTTDYVQGTNVGDLDILDVADLSSTPTTIYIVKPVDWAQKTDASARAIAVGIDSGGTIDDGANQVLQSTVGRFARPLLLNPNGSVAWTAAAVNALKRRLKVAA
jgi:hypothetical protein